MQEKKSMSAATAFITVFGLSFMYGSTVFLNPAMQLMIEAFPDVPTSSVRMISSLSSIIGVITSLSITIIAGKRLKHKPVAVLGALLTLIGGAGPYFIGNRTIMQLYAWRVIYGLGIGCVTVKNATIRRLFANLVESAKYLGVSMAVVNVTAVVGQIIAGYLADMNWMYCFLLYAVGIIPLLINTILLKEPETETEPEKKDGTKNPSRARMNPRVFLYMAMMVVSCVWLNPVFSISTLLSERNLGTAAVAGTVISMYTLGNALTSTIFGKVYKNLQKYGYAICTVGVVAGLSCIVFGYNIFVVGLGVFMAGAFSNIKRLFLMQWAGDVSDESNKSIASTMLMTGLSLGSFFSVYWITLSDFIGQSFTMFQTEITRTYAISTVLFILVAIVTFIKTPNPKNITLDQ